MPYGIPDAEGGFEVVVLPGRGVIGVRAATYGYLKPHNAEAFEGYDRKFQNFEKVVPRLIPVVNFHAMAETDYPPGTETATLDLVADPGRTTTLAIVDPDGKPLGGTAADGVEGILGSRGSRHDAPEIVVKSLDPLEPRRVTVRHAGRRLIGSIVLKGEEAGPITLKLQPWAELKGRIVDDEGNPRPKLSLGSGGLKSAGSRRSPSCRVPTSAAASRWTGKAASTSSASFPACTTVPMPRRRASSTSATWSTR